MVPFSRRRVVVLGTAAAAGLAGALSGCTASGHRGGPGETTAGDAGGSGTGSPSVSQSVSQSLSSSQPTRSPDDPQLADVRDERRLIAAYDAVLAAFPKLTPRLAPIRTDHAAHLEALQAMAGPASHHVAPPTAPAKSASTGAALAALRAAEKRAVAARTTSCVAAPRDRAPMLGSIAASESVHAMLLS